MKKTVLALLCGTFLSFQVRAGLSDAILSYNYQQYPAALAEFSYLQEEGNPVAAYYLGRMYQLGQGVPVDLRYAMRFYKMADAAYYFPASAELGKLLMDAGDVSNGLALLKKSALTGDAFAINELANAYAEGKGVEQNPRLAFEFFRLAATSGNMKAQYQIAKMYFDGRGVPQDYTQAKKWLTRAADQGYVLAQIDLAELYTNDNLLKNIPLAYKWYSIIAAYNSDSIGQKAAEKRDILLRGKNKKGLNKKNLAEIQSEVGRWKPQKAENSISIEELAQIQKSQIDGFNDPKTLQQIILDMGFLPRDGRLFGVTIQMVDDVFSTQNVQPLIDEIERAAKDGKVEAYGYLADLFSTRLDNPVEAFLWYQKGADAGDAYAQYQLAQMYCEGIGISQPDAAACYAWLLNVQNAKDPVLNVLAQQAIAIVQSSATQDELTRGLALSEEHKKSFKEGKISQKSSGGFL